MLASGSLPLRGFFDPAVFKSSSGIPKVAQEVRGYHHHQIYG
jgi:hypothetical protein